MITLTDAFDTDQSHEVLLDADKIERMAPRPAGGCILYFDGDIAYEFAESVETVRALMAKDWDRRHAETSGN